MKMMKKNKMMRAASVLLVAVLLTTSIISGTFAKYVTSGDVSDSARVAKFGVTVTSSGKLFDKTYFNVNNDKSNLPGGTTTETDDNTVLTVEATENVVAPGTKGPDADPLTLSVTGKPEVDVLVSFAIADDYKDVFLKASTGDKYPDMTTAATGDKFDVTTSWDYRPLTYTLTGDLVEKFKDNAATTNVTYNASTKSVKGALGQIKKFIAAMKTEGKDGIYVDANTDLSTASVAEGGIGTLTLTWEWPFGDPTNNKADTLLGDIAAQGTDAASVTLDGVQLTKDTDYNLVESLKITTTVTQVD